MKRTYEMEAAGVTLAANTITQAMLEDYMQTYRDLLPESKISGAENNGAVVRAAFACGWFAEPESFSVDAAAPWLVTWIAGIVNEIYVAAVTVPKK